MEKLEGKGEYLEAIKDSSQYPTLMEDPVLPHTTP